MRPPISLLLTISLSLPLSLRLTHLQTLLPALHGSLPTQLFLALLPFPLFLLSIFLPPILLLPLLPLLPPIAASVHPLIELCILPPIISLAARNHTLPFLATTLLLLLFSPQQLTEHPLAKSLLPHAPSLITSLTLSIFAIRSQTLPVLLNRLSRPAPTKQRKHRRRAKNAPSPPSSSSRPLLVLPFLLVFAYLLSQKALAPLGPSLSAHIHPRKMPPNYTILAQTRGPTGLISVVQLAGRYRLLTADMSVLGGRHTKKGFAQDSIFAQFHVHEAVRLTKRPGEPATEKGGKNGKALCIGLGVGIVPDALHRLGTYVDAVEIDPVVIQYAAHYFGMSVPNIAPVDAVKFLEQAHTVGRKYDYVVHDVFTGGAVPAELFAMSTWRAIRNVLEDDGVLAVNFVGALDDPPNTPATAAVALVYDRLQSAFEHVRLFSDGHDTRTHNFVFFASSVPERMTFRDYIEDDLLASAIRKETLDGFQKHEVPRETLGTGVEDVEGSDWVLHMGQWDTCREHLRLMKSIHPGDLWPALLVNEQLG